MSEIELLFQKILDRYPAQSNLELKILGVKERPEYGDKIIRRRYILTVDYDILMGIDEEYQSSLGFAKVKKSD